MRTAGTPACLAAAGGSALRHRILQTTSTAVWVVCMSLKTRQRWFENSSSLSRKAGSANPYSLRVGRSRRRAGPVVQPRAARDRRSPATFVAELLRTHERGDDARRPGARNPVRVIDALADATDLGELRVRRRRARGDGPAYHPSVLLKLYIYGYLNRVQSARGLEREAGRNVEVMWLTGRPIDPALTARGRPPSIGECRAPSTHPLRRRSRSLR